MQNAIIVKTTSIIQYNIMIYEKYRKKTISFTEHNNHDSL